MHWLGYGQRPSLVKLMIFVVIIVLFTSIATPQYQTYTLLTQVCTQISVAKRPIQAAISEYLYLHGRLPNSDFTELSKVDFVR